MKCPIQGCHGSQQWGCPTSSLSPKRKVQAKPSAKKGREMQPLRSHRARTAWGINQQRFYFQCSYKLKHVPFWGGLNIFNLAESGWFSEGTPSLTDQWDHRTGLCSQIKDLRPFCGSAHMGPAAAAKPLMLFLGVMRPLGCMLDPHPNIANCCGEFGPKLLTFGRTVTI